VSRIVVGVAAPEEASSGLRSIRALHQSVLSCCEHWPPGASERR
jgi:hypothetical protein